MSRATYPKTWQEIIDNAHRAATALDASTLRYLEAHLWLTLYLALGGDEGYRRAVEMGRELSTVPLPGEPWLAPGQAHRDRVMLACFDSERSALADAVDESLGGVGDLMRMAAERTRQHAGEPQAQANAVIAYERTFRPYCLDCRYLVPLVGGPVHTPSGDWVEPGRVIDPAESNVDAERVLADTRLVRDGRVMLVGAYFAQVHGLHARE